MTLEANVINAIVHTMDCDRCPEPCKAYHDSSLSNCVNHWSTILSKLNPNADWKKVNDEIFAEWCKERT